MSDVEHFMVYQGSRRHEMAVAAQVTEANYSALAHVVGGAFDSGTDGRGRIVFTGADNSETPAEIGDYIVADMAGGYLCVDKEMFETYYTRQSGEE